jgi:type I restriction enzyme S subunit
MSKIAEGYKQTEVGIIPSDWLLFSLEELTPKNRQYTIVDGPFGSNLKTIHYRKSGIPIITSGYVTDGKFSASEYLYVDLEKFKQEKRSAVKGGDIVMAKIGERCGASAILPKEHPEGILSGNALKISIDENRFSTELIAHILWRYHTKGDFEILRTTGAQPALSMANLKKYKISLPCTKTEQTAIATALNDADTLITQLEKLIAKKRNIKQGAMQELLTGKKRLPGFGGKLVSMGNGKLRDLFEISPPRKQIGRDEVVTFIGMEDVSEDGTIISHNLLPYSEIKNGLTYFEKKDVLVAKITPCFENGKGACLDNLKTEKGFGSTEFHILRANNNSVPRYVFYHTQSAKFRRKLEAEMVGSAGQKRVSSSAILNYPLSIVHSKAEQTAVAQILSDMDAEIEALEQKLVKYRMIKQGMMQELLTGKTRLV